MFKLNEKMPREPIGGHHFASHGVTFKGDSFKEVVSQLRAFRINNNIAVGDPAQDVLIFYAENFPWMVEQDWNAEPKKENKYYVRWRDWIYGQWKNPPKKVLTTKEASDRWKICLDCPWRLPFVWKKTDESQELIRRAFMLRRGVEIPKDLGYCALHRVDLGVFCFLENPEVQSAQQKDGAKEPKCWVK